MGMKVQQGGGVEEGVKIPLLSASPSSSNCPGCLLQQRKLTSNGAAPTKLLTFVAFISLCNALPIASLFPFIYFMVRDFQIAKVDTQIGSFAGYIGSALMVGRFMTSTLWGIVADKYGRKPVILIGTSSTIILNVIFGFSTNFWMAFATRFLMGVTNGMLGAIKAYASEVCSADNQALGVSMGNMWSFGLVVGPALGGYLAQPSTKYPTIFPSGSLFDRFPYALPCICISAIIVPAFISGFWIPETIHNHATGVVADEEQIQENDTENRREEIDSSKVLKYNAVQPLWRNWGFMVATYVYCGWGLHSMAYNEIFSLWAVSPTKYGGLGFTTSDVGNALVVAGSAILLFQLFVFAPLSKIVGPLRMVQVPAALTVILTAMYPLISNLRGATLWAVLLTVAVVKNVFSACVTVGSSLLLNNSVITAQRGAANGASTSMMSLFKAIGPATAGIIFSWGESRAQASFLPGMWMVFTTLSVFAVIALIPSFEPITPRSLEKPLPE